MAGSKSSYVIVSLFLTIAGIVKGFPNGAPSCDLPKPSHGAEGEKVSVLVKRDKRGNVNLSIDSPHRGVLLRADTPGTWSNLGDELQEKDTCVTHTSRSDKTSTQVTFTPNDPSIEPKFSGFIVERYTLFHPLNPVYPGAQPKETENSLLGSILNVFG